MTSPTPQVVVDVGNPLEAGSTVFAAAAAASLAVDVDLTLVGDAQALTRTLSVTPHDAERVRVLDAAGVVDGGASYEDACAQLPGSSLVRALREVARLPHAVLVSSGHAGAAVHAAHQTLGMLAPGVRPALAAVIPTLQRRGDAQDPYALLLDVGACPDATARDLVHWAQIGAAYAAVVSRNQRPRVAVLSSDPRTGPLPEHVHAAISQLQQHADTHQGPGAIEFLGGITADRIVHGDADVIVTSGFGGGTVLATLQGVSSTADHLLTQARSRLQWRVGVSMLGRGLEALRARTNWENYGGEPILGCKRLVILARHDAQQPACLNAIRLAMKLQRHDAIAQMQHALAAEATS